MGKQAGKKVNEKYLIDQARKNPALFAPLYDNYFQPIFLFVFKRVQNEYLTNDITQRVFLKAMLNLDKYEDRGFPFSSWLYRIASNEVNMHFRNQKKHCEVRVYEKDLKVLANDIQENEKDYSALIEVLNSLPEDEVNLIEMRYFEERPFKEIANILGITEANAKMKVYRLTKKMQKLLVNKK